MEERLGGDTGSHHDDDLMLNDDNGHHGDVEVPNDVPSAEELMSDDEHHDSELTTNTPLKSPSGNTELVGQDQLPQPDQLSVTTGNDGDVPSLTVDSEGVDQENCCHDNTFHSHEDTLSRHGDEAEKHGVTSNENTLSKYDNVCTELDDTPTEEVLHNSVDKLFNDISVDELFNDNTTS